MHMALMQPPPRHTQHMALMQHHPATHRFINAPNHLQCHTKHPMATVQPGYCMLQPTTCALACGGPGPGMLRAIHVHVAHKQMLVCCACSHLVGVGLCIVHAPTWWAFLRYHVKGSCRTGIATVYHVWLYEGSCLCTIVRIQISLYCWLEACSSE